MRRTLSRFASDRNAGAAMDVSLFALGILVPIAFFVLLYRYLRRTAPDGTVLGTTTLVNAAPVGAAPDVKGIAANVSGARTCRRCGIAVKAYRGPEGLTCPNCGTGLYL